jgi:hypothetical protein
MSRAFGAWMFLIPSSSSQVARDVFWALFEWNRRDDHARRRDDASEISSDFRDTMSAARRDEVVERRWLETGTDQPHGLSAFPLSPDRKASETVPILGQRTSKIRTIDTIHSSY